ncbi:olfactory receptor 10AC1-like [Canis lupus baileyi]|uniref:olfactory receptor 10AC1-like n=1 Tax=Canis lupus baileyi TaxID=143281 RepID=UPI003B970C58
MAKDGVQSTVRWLTFGEFTGLWQTPQKALASLGRPWGVPGAGRGGRASEGEGPVFSGSVTASPLSGPDACPPAGPDMSSWPASNWTAPAEFVILGFSGWPQGLRLLLFAFLLPLYLATLAGNLLILGLAVAEPALHCPMYFFLGALSAVEVAYTLALTPRMLAGFLLPPAGLAVARSTCAAQMGLFVALGGAECLLLAAMALDRYLAICRPLYYPQLMSTALCWGLLASCCAGGSILALGLTTAIFQLPFCQGGLVNHVFCDLPAVLLLACGDRQLQERVLLAACLLLLVLPLALILLSYTRVLVVILGVGGSAGRRKAFNTVASHLTVAVLHYGCATAMYARPLSSRSLEEDKLVSLIYINLTPLLYPAIYTLRNRDVQGALQRVLSGRTPGTVHQAEGN